MKGIHTKMKRQDRAMAQRGKKGMTLKESETGGGRMMCKAPNRQSGAGCRRGAGCPSAIRPVSYSVSYSVGCSDGSHKAIFKLKFFFSSGELCPSSSKDCSSPKWEHSQMKTGHIIKSYLYHMTFSILLVKLYTPVNVLCCCSASCA